MDIAFHLLLSKNALLKKDEKNSSQEKKEKFRNSYLLFSYKVRAREIVSRKELKKAAMRRAI